MTIDDEARAYEESRARVDEIVRHRSTDELSTIVPCCPKWTAKDLVGHLAGVLEDRRDKRLPATGFEEWTFAQVDRHRDEPIGVVLDTWARLPVERNDDVPSLSALSFDVVTHEHDLCHALGVAGDRDTFSVEVGASRAKGRMASMLTEAGAPGVRLTTEAGDELVEGAAPPIGLTTTTYGFMRLVTARVSRAQAAALAWDGDATPVLDALFADGFFTLQPVDVIEADAS
ncbi:MAG TPA: maleylpyruvate isomerase N-terminal domain-containing protein [Acidimicrobiales bacterium]|jgi:hypothetical protein|nr:maleylpyruvate isomerase N-terminal domain-containing protein [Acidimicrobiales bacterium]